MAATEEQAIEQAIILKLAERVGDLAGKLDKEVCQPVSNVKKIQEAKPFSDPNKATGIERASLNSGLVNSLHETLVDSQQKLSKGQDKGLGADAGGLTPSGGGGST